MRKNIAAHYFIPFFSLFFKPLSTPVFLMSVELRAFFLLFFCVGLQSVVGRGMRTCVALCLFSFAILAMHSLSGPT